MRYENESAIVEQINGILGPLREQLYSKPSPVDSIDDFFAKYGNDFHFAGVFSHIVKKVKFPSEALDNHIDVFNKFEAFGMLAQYQDLPEPFIEKHINNFKEYPEELSLYQKFSDGFLRRTGNTIVNPNTYFLKNQKSLDNDDSIYFTIIDIFVQAFNGNEFVGNSNKAMRKEFRENTAAYIEKNELLELLHTPEPKLNINRLNFNCIYHVADNMLNLEWDAITKSEDLSCLVQDFYRLDERERAYFLETLTKAFAAELGIPAPIVEFRKSDKDNYKTLANAKSAENPTAPSTVTFCESLLVEPDLAEYLDTVAHELYHVIKGNYKNTVLDKLRQGPSFRHDKYQAAYYMSELYQKGYDEYLSEIRYNSDKQQEEMEAIFIHSHINRVFDKKILNKNMYVPLTYFYDINENYYWDDNLVHKKNACIMFGMEENKHIPGKIKKRLDEIGMPEFATAEQYLVCFENVLGDSCSSNKASFQQRVCFEDYHAEELYYKNIEVGFTEQKASLNRMLQYPNWHRIFPKDFFESLTSGKYPKMCAATGWGYDNWFLEGNLKPHHLYAAQQAEEVPGLANLYTGYKDLEPVKQAAGNMADAKKCMGVKPFQTFKVASKDHRFITPQNFKLEYKEDKQKIEQRPVKPSELTDLQTKLEESWANYEKLLAEFNILKQDDKSRELIAVQDELAKTKAAYDELQIKYSDLSDIGDKLSKAEADLAELAKNYAELKKQDKSAELAKVIAELEKRNSEYAELLEKYNQLKAMPVDKTVIPAPENPDVQNAAQKFSGMKKFLNNVGKILDEYGL